jgi:hypothetical protein
MNEQYKAAFVRASITGSLTGATTFLSTWATTSNAKTIFIAGATAFLTPFVARFGGEGRIDTQRVQRSGGGDSVPGPALAPTAS